MTAEDKKGLFQRLKNRFGRAREEEKPVVDSPAAAAMKADDPQSENISQARLVEQLMPMLERRPNKFRKTRQVHARSADDGEEIVTLTTDGVETTNVARTGDMVVRNLTGAQELYIISAKSFPRLYEKVEEVDDTWSLFDPKGEVLAIEVTPTLTDELGVNSDFLIEAPWGSNEQVRIGDYLVAPFPALKKIYRIAQVEFEQTYSQA